MSGQPCGCDPEAHWICDVHRAKQEEDDMETVLAFVKERPMVMTVERVRVERIEVPVSEADDPSMWESSALLLAERLPASEWDLVSDDYEVVEESQK